MVDFPAKHVANPKRLPRKYRISFDMLKFLHRASVFFIPKPKAVKHKTIKTHKNSKTLNPDNLKLKSLRLACGFIHPLVTSK
jgi:hypothetical protein